MDERIDSASDDRTANNAVRHQYRMLSEAEKSAMVWFKDTGASFIAYCDEIVAAGNSNGREFALAKTKIEEAVMWAAKGVTG